MDTNIIEPEQGAAVAAELLQQDSQVEVVGSKPSAVPPDEDRLAAGVSTTRLQTKRPSGAQWRMLIKVKKMKEVTWTVEKPPSKTPSSQEKVVAGSSGGVKRPHSDSSTPPSTHSNLKNPEARKCRLGLIRKLLLESRWQ
jgi:hypothetical protein